MNDKEYALETMDEGVLVITENGKINYANSYAREVFDITTESSTFFRDILADPSGINDEIIDLTNDVIYDEKKHISRVIRYVDHTGKKFSLLVSCTKKDEHQFVFTFSDQTDLVEEGRKRRDSTIVLTMFFLVACLWTVGVAVWMRTGEVFNVKYFTLIIEVIGILGLLVILKTTSLSIRDFGLSLQNLGPTLKRSCIRVLILLSVMSVTKLCMLKFIPRYFPSDTPFWDWRQADIRLFRYLITAFVQEFLARGGIQSALTRAYDGKYRKDAAIFSTSLYFMTLHFQYGLAMMFGAGILSILLGYIYKKDNNIYGAVIIHYCFGKFADFLSLI